MSVVKASGPDDPIQHLRREARDLAREVANLARAADYLGEARLAAILHSMAGLLEAEPALRSPVIRPAGANGDGRAKDPA